MWVYFWVLYLVPLVYISVYVTVSYCLDDCSFVVYAKFRESDSFILFFFLRIALDLNVLLESVCWHFAEDFCIYVLQWYWPVIFFFCGIFVWFWYWGDGSLIEWVWKCFTFILFYFNILQLSCKFRTSRKCQYFNVEWLIHV